MKYLIAALFTLATAATQAQTLLRVGDEPSCDFATVRDAHLAVPTNAADGDYHILVNQDVVIDQSISLNRSIQITGGYTSCGGSPSGVTEIDGNRLPDGSSGIITGGGANDLVIRVNNFALRNLNGITGAGILFTNGNAAIHMTLVLNNVMLLDNGRTDTVTSGGGIAMVGPGGKHLVLQSVELSGNRASRGGAIACDSGTVEFQSGIVSNNEAVYYSGNPDVENAETGLGGGMYLENCQLLARNDASQNDEQRLLQNNRALRVLTDFPANNEFGTVSEFGGGALYLVDSRMDLPRPHPLMVDDNRAELAVDDHTVSGADNRQHHGGGILLNRSEANIRALRLTGNQAGIGGGLYVGEDSSATLDGVISRNTACGQTNQEACILIADNRAVGNYDILRVVGFKFCSHSPAFGGGIFSAGRSLTINKVLFRDNEASYDDDACLLGIDNYFLDPAGAAIALVDSDTRITNSVFHQHKGLGADSVFSFTLNRDEQQIQFINNTVSEFTSSGDEGEDFAFINGRVSADGRLQIDSSLMLDSNFTLPLLSSKLRSEFSSRANADLSVRCSVLDDSADPSRLASIASTDQLIDGGQTLTDPDNGDFSPDTNGSAQGIDACGYDLLVAETTLDGRNRHRPQDVPGIDNGGVVDAGAMEAIGDNIAFFDVVPEVSLDAPNENGDPLLEAVNVATPVSVSITLRNDGLSPAPINTGFRYIMRGVDPSSVAVNGGIFFACSQAPFDEYAVEISCDTFLGPILPQDPLSPVVVTALADGVDGVTRSYLQGVNVTFPFDQVDAITNNNSVFGTLVVTGSNPQADVSVTMQSDAQTVQPGQTARFEVTVANAGPSIASEVMLSANVPSNASIVGESSVGFACDIDDLKLDCLIPAMANGESRTVELNVRAPDVESPVTVVAIANALEPDPFNNNNTATETIQVQSLSDALFSSGFE